MKLRCLTLHRDRDHVRSFKVVNRKIIQKDQLSICAHMWMASVTSVKSITRNSSTFVLCSNTCTFIYIWHTHAHRYKSLHPTHVAPGLWSTGGGWVDEGGLQVIKISCGFVSVSSANPPSDKSEAYHSTAVSHSFCPFSFLSSPPPLLSHTAFHHYFRPHFCSGL